MAERGQVSSLAHTHPRDSLLSVARDYIDVTRIILSDKDLTIRQKAGTIAGMTIQAPFERAFERSRLNRPSTADLEHMGENRLYRVADYIASPKGVLEFTPNFERGWAPFAEVAAADAGIHWWDQPGRMREAGANAAFIGKYRRYAAPEGYTEAVRDVTAEMKNAINPTTRTMLSQAIDRMVIGNPLLEFIPESVKVRPVPKTGIVGTGNAGDQYLKPGRGYAIPAAKLELKPMAEIPTAAKPADRVAPVKVTGGKGTENVRGATWIPKAAAAASVPELVNSFVFTGIPAGRSDTKRPSQQPISRPARSEIQAKAPEYIRAYVVGSDVRNTQRSKSDTESIKAYAMASAPALASVSKTGQTNARAFAQATPQMTGQITGQIPKLTQRQQYQMIDIIRPIEPVTPVTPIVPIGGFPSLGGGGGGGGTRTGYGRRLEQLFRPAFGSVTAQMFGRQKTLKVAKIKKPKKIVKRRRLR